MHFAAATATRVSYDWMHVMVYLPLSTISQFQHQFSLCLLYLCDLCFSDLTLYSCGPCNYQSILHFLVPKKMVELCATLCGAHIGSVQSLWVDKMTPNSHIGWNRGKNKNFSLDLRYSHFVKHMQLNFIAIHPF